MKIYTSTFDLAYPSNARFWVAPNSDFKIGLKITNKGEDYTGNFALKSGSTTFTPDASKTAGFTTYTMKSLGTGAVTYEIDVPGAQQKFTLMQIVTDSTVFEVGALSGGGDVPADVATQTWVNSQISDFITEDDLTGYATQDELTGYATKSEIPVVNNARITVNQAGQQVATFTLNQSADLSIELSGGGDVPADVATKTWVNEQISDFITDDDLTGYATKNDLTSKADTSSLTAYATTDELTGYATKNDLTSKADVSSLTAYAEVTSLTAYATQNDLTSKADVSSLTAYATTDELTAYATKNDLTSKADVSSLTAYAETSALNDVALSVGDALTAITDINENQIPVINSTLALCVQHQAYGEAPEVLQIVTAYESEWETLSAETDESTFYVVLPDPVTP